MTLRRPRRQFVGDWQHKPTRRKPLVSTGQAGPRLPHGGQVLINGKNEVRLYIHSLFLLPVSRLHSELRAWGTYWDWSVPMGQKTYLPQIKHIVDPNHPQRHPTLEELQAPARFRDS